MLISTFNKKHYDIAIVGAGPAGISLALKLTENNKKNVILIESGLLTYDKNIHHLSKVDSLGDLSNEYFSGHSQRVLGGSSTVWTGFCSQLETRAFTNKEWPISFDELSKYYPAAAGILELPQESYTYANKKISNNNHSLLYRPYFKSKPVRFGEKYFQALKSSDQIDVLLGHSCKEIISKGDRVTELLISETLAADKKFIVTAHDYILACGGIGNAKLMLVNQLADKSPVGQYFMEHPHIFGAGQVEINKDMIDPVLLPRLGERKVVHALQLSDQFCIDNNLLSFTVAFKDKNESAQSILGTKVETYTSDVEIRAEMTPLKRNVISLNDNIDLNADNVPKIDFKFRYQDMAQRCWQAFAKELLISGLGRATVAPKVFEPITGGGHFMGSTRMGLDQSQSVVDSNCRVHGVNNLYIAGSSIFPSSGASNPTYSIVALSLRLAEHILNKH